MRSRGFEGMVCSAADVLGALGDRWGTLLMRDLLLGLTRYEDLRRSTGATNATLSDRLRELEANGLVERRRYQTRPDRYEYLPTPRGRDLKLLLTAMVQIGDTWNLADREGPPLRFVDTRTGRRVALALVDAETRELVSAGHVAVEAGCGADAVMRWRLERAAALRKAGSDAGPVSADGDATPRAK
ncbi:winged helix-turn-helix transcriptional regulator [Methylorubrum suomiense]|nr:MULTISPECIES: helix-turn-helix domain-containing protein [Methylobacteriaceae]